MASASEASICPNDERDPHSVPGVLAGARSIAEPDCADGAHG